MTIGPVGELGSFREGASLWLGMNFLTPTGLVSPLSSRTRATGAGPGIPGIRTAPWSTAFFGISTPGHHGVMSLPAMGLGKPSMIGSIGGRKDGNLGLRIVTSLLDQLDDAGRISRELWVHRCVDHSCQSFGCGSA